MWYNVFKITSLHGGAKMEAARSAMHEYYRGHDIAKGHSVVTGRVFNDKAFTESYNEKYNAIFSEMDAFYAANPTTPLCLLKSKLHTLIAKQSEPMIFPHCPFFFEIGLDQSGSWGAWKTSPAYWLELRKNADQKREHPYYEQTTNHFSLLFDREKMNLCEISDPFDIDHNTLGYLKLFKGGVGGIIREAEAKMKDFPEGSDGYAFCSAVIESSAALIGIAHKFADKAEKMLEECTDDKQCRSLKMIAEAARKVPENPPETFHQGLAMLIFLREVIAVMENMGISQLGRIDLLLGELYERDIREGRLTEDDARELVSLWMMNTDIKFDVADKDWPDTSTCITLGGCDEDGNDVFNAVTRIIIEEHYKNGFINPKLNCRYSKNSSREYLKLIGKTVIGGHNTYALINEDIVIDGLVKSGVLLRDARRFTNGGCQETLLEGMGHTEGAALYVSMLRIMDLFLRADEYSEFLTPIDGADSFEEFYSKFMSVMNQFLSIMTDQRNYRQSFYKNALCCPLYSAMQEGCIENGTDHIRGGAKYNFSTIALVGFANIVDSLYALKTFVYDKKRLTLTEFNSILSNNWDGNEKFRSEVLHLPKYGHGNVEVDTLANRFLSDLCSIVKSRKNERGGNYLPSLFVYSKNRRFAKLLRATPDGRRNYDYMAQGCSPTQLVPIEDITVPMQTMRNIDFTECGGGISVHDVILPVSSRFDEDIFASFMLGAAECRCVTIQPNCVSKNDLLAARREPEKYKNLIVRICGLSAYFVNLLPEVQDEIIARNFYTK